MKQTTLHVAVIMDGNGRWANIRRLPRIAGHRAGAEALRAVVEAAPSCAIRTLSAYAFSSDNWKRPPEEVNGLMALFADYLDEEVPRLAVNGVRLSVVGRRDRLPNRLLEAIEDAEQATRAGARLHLQLAIDYSARETILRATASPQAFEQLLGKSEPVDLLIRTGGDQRLSDFMLWECAYAELLFTRSMWPEFGAAELHRSVSEFHRRERRFGAIRVAPEAEFAVAAPGAERWLL